MICWGKQNGKRRFKCKNCGLYFTSENKSVSLKNKETWFKKWIVGKQTYDQISAESGYSVSTLQRYFNVMLSKAPKLSYSHNKEVYLLIDGTYFSNEICLVVYRIMFLNKPSFTELLTESIMKNSKRIWRIF
ncbi:hypothetical protein ACV0BM_017070 [Elizabethkingia meningoseptica]